MRLWQLALKEALHRRLSFGAGLVSVAIAVGCVAGALSLLQAHDARTEAVITEKEAETRAAMVRMENDYRRIMRDMGYNVLVLHEDQDIGALHASGVPDQYMPEAYADKLAEGGITTLNHLLPVLQQRTRWEEQGVDVLVAGIKGQVPIAHRRPAAPGTVGADGTPIMEPVPRGQVDIGYGIAQRTGLEPDDTLVFNERALTVNKSFPQRGAQDDMTLWVHLEQAQEWFDKPDLINGVLALECICEADALGRITADVQRILPDTQVFEFSSLVRTRALARGRAAEAHQEAIEAERQNRAVMREEREQMASVLAPLAVVGAAIWIFLGTFVNVRDRRGEIGILRALGYGGPKIIGLFQVRTFLMAGIGAPLGYVSGVFIGAVLGGAPSLGVILTELVSPARFLIALVAAVALACCAAWLPAMKAAAQDPAEILQEMI